MLGNAFAIAGWAWAIDMVAMMVAIVAFKYKYPGDMVRLAVRTVLSALLAFGSSLFFVYFGLPNTLGGWGGLEPRLMILLVVLAMLALAHAVSAGIGAFIDEDRGFSSRHASSDKGSKWIPGAAAFILLFAVFVLGGAFQGILYNTGPAMTANAHIAKITNHTGLDAFPQTDEKHLVITTTKIACYNAQQVLGSAGTNIGSQYQIQCDDTHQPVLQSINQHLWYVLPLTYRNGLNQFSTGQTPGYVVVDAENPNSTAKLQLGHPIRYTTDALFNLDLLRHVYSSGYDNCDLLDPTLELPDSLDAQGYPNGTPYYSVACAHSRQSVFSGELIDTALIVNAETGQIQSYPLAQVPTWVDRVYDQSTVNDYISWWARYNFSPWFNLSGAGNRKVENIQLLYSKADQEPVWVMPITSDNGSDNSSLGFMLCQSRENQCDYYEAGGYGLGSNVKDVFSSAPGNAAFHYDVNTPQFVNLYGTPAWVTTYTRTTSDGTGDIFEAVGIVPAQNGQLAANNVIMNQTLAGALSQFQSYLANVGNKNGQTPTSQNIGTTVSGTVFRITPIVSGTQQSYLLMLTGSANIYRVDYNAQNPVYPYIPFVQAGDKVTLTYLDDGQKTLSVANMTDTTLGH